MNNNIVYYENELKKFLKKINFQSLKKLYRNFNIEFQIENTSVARVEIIKNKSYFKTEYITKVILPNNLDDVKKFRGRLIHELMHIFSFHLDRASKVQDMIINLNGHPVSLWNVATDLAINEYIKTVFNRDEIDISDGVLLEKFPKEIQNKIGNKLVSEHIFNVLKEEYKNYEQEIKETLENIINQNKNNNNQGNNNQDNNNQGNNNQNQNDNQADNNNQNNNNQDNNNQNQNDNNNQENQNNNNEINANFDSHIVKIIEKDENENTEEKVEEISKVQNETDIEVNEAEKQKLQENRIINKIVLEEKEIIKNKKIKDLISLIKTNHQRSLKQCQLKYNYTFRRINRKKSGLSSVIYKGKTKEFIKPINLVVAIDTSGSVSDDELKLAINIVKKMLFEFNLNLNLIQIDDKIQKVYTNEELRKSKTLKEMEIYGRGNTHFQPFFNYIYREFIKNKGLSPKDINVVYITDGDASPRLDNYGIKNVIWVINNDDPSRHGEFAEYIKFGKIFKVPLH